MAKIYNFLIYRFLNSPYKNISKVDLDSLDPQEKEILEHYLRSVWEIDPDEFYKTIRRANKIE